MEKKPAHKIDNKIQDKSEKKYQVNEKEDVLFFRQQPNTGKQNN